MGTFKFNFKFIFSLNIFTVIKYFVSNTSAFIYILSNSFFVVLFDKDWKFFLFKIINGQMITPKRI